MKAVAFTWVLFFLTLLMIDNTVAAEITATYGQSVVIRNGVNPDQQDKAATVAIQQSSQVHLGVKALAYRSSESKYDFASSNYYGVFVGAESSGDLKAFGSLGVGYLTNPDGKWNGRLTDNLQFNITAGLKYAATTKVSLVLQLDHISNCTQICNRSSAHLPNVGRNYLSTGIGYRF